jgi:hypothetical protein
MDDLLREAIADAKAVRETALANAKIALEEAFTPRLQSMLSKKIASEMEDKEEDEMEEAMHDKEEGEHEEGEHEEGEHEEMRDAEEGEHEEGEHEEGEHEEMRDADEMDAEEMRDSEEGEHEEMRDADEEEAEEMRDADEEEMDEAEDAEETEDSEEMREEEDAEETDDVDEDELDLESVLAELEKDLDDEEKMDEVEDKDEEDKEEEMHETATDASSEIGAGDNKLNAAQIDSSKIGAQGPEGEGSDKPAGKELGDHEIVDDLKEVEDKDEEDLDLDEVLRALTEEDKEEEDAEENEKLKAEIKEHRKVIHFMRSKLNEVNLLNAKLLFSNKLFRAFGLNNNQKLKVVETFDRTKNLREVKLVYATLAESFKRPGKRISESVKKGSASKPVRSTKPKAVLSEGQELKNRFKKLANIL